MEIGLDFGGTARLGRADGVLAFSAGLAGVLGAVGLLLDLVGDGDDFHLPGVVADEIDLVDHGVEAVVVGAEGLEDLPDDFVDLVVLERFVRLHARGDDDGQDDVAVVLFPSGALRMTRPTDWTTSTWELRGVRKSTASSAGTSTPSERQRTLERMRQVLSGDGGLEPVEFFLLLAGVHGAVHVVGFAEQGVVGVLLFLIGGRRLCQNMPAICLELTLWLAAGGALDDLAEGDGAASCGSGSPS